MDTIHASEFEKMYADNKGSINLIDVRTLEEFEAGHIPTAKNIDIRTQSFAEDIAKLPRDKTYHIVCRSGARSASACEYMESIGFQDVTNITGGMLDWKGETE